MGVAALVDETLGCARDEQDARRMSHNPATIGTSPAGHSGSGMIATACAWACGEQRL